MLQTLEGKPVSVDEVLDRVYEESGAFGMDTQLRQTGPEGVDIPVNLSGDNSQGVEDVLDLASQVLAAESTPTYEDEAERYLIPRAQFRRFVIASMFPDHPDHFWDTIEAAAVELEEPQAVSQHRELSALMFIYL